MRISSLNQSKLDIFPRKLLLVSLDWTRPKDPPLSLGHASILTHLKNKNVNVTPYSWSVHHSGFHPNQVINIINDYAKPGVDLGIGAFIWNEVHIQTILNAIKKNFPGRIILGGSQVSYTKEGLEDFYPQADVFIRGYAEEALASLMLSPQTYPAIKGVHFAGHPDLGQSATADLELLPSPYLTGLIQPQPFIRWETQRGCPFECAFCQHRSSDAMTKRRQFPESRIIKEIDFILSNPIINDIAVLDPVFNSGPHYIKVLEHFARGGYKGKLALQCRMEMITPEFLHYVNEINKTGNVVLEFGLQTIHREEEKLIQRPNNMNKIHSVLDKVNELGIASEVSLIFGLPKQTVASFQASIDFCKEKKIPTIYAYPLNLHRGTPLYDRKKELGLIESAEAHPELLGDDHIGHVIQSPSFTVDDWKKMAALAKDLDNYNAQNKKNASLMPKMENTLKYTLWNTDKTPKAIPKEKAALAISTLPSVNRPI